MRLLLSFVISSLFILTHLPCDAAGNVNKVGKLHTISGVSQYGKKAIAVSHRISFVTKANQHRSLPGFNPYHGSTSFKHSVYYQPVIRLEESYTYCTAIGQKLLYPKHYFW